MNDLQKVHFIGGGAIATALGNVLAKKGNIDVTLITIESDVADAINNSHLNPKYFPGMTLERSLKASSDFSLLEERAMVFIAIPSTKVTGFFTTRKIHPDSVLVNLAKGFGDKSETIICSLSAVVKNQLCSMKGPSFAREIINNQHTAFTLGCLDDNTCSEISGLFQYTSVHLDFSKDIQGVEILSILKNIYAIAIGVVDAQFESPNLKFLMFTKALHEIRALVRFFGGKEETIFNYCGIGDYALTALNDLSRNRTLGLFLGKGFFTDHISDKVVLEGKNAVDVIYHHILQLNGSVEKYPVLHELYRVFNEDYDISGFVPNLLSAKN